MARRALGMLLVAAGSLAPAASAPAAPGEPERADAVRAERRAERALERAEDLSEGRGVRTGRELSPALKELAIRLPALDRPERREARALLARPPHDNSLPPTGGYASGATVRSHCPLVSRFCVHWVETTEDAPELRDGDADTVPDYVELVAAELERSDAVETGTLGWRPPKGDGTVGGLFDRTDVYLKNLGRSFGVAVPDDPDQQTASRYAYLILDDDFAEHGLANPVDGLKATVAHEYNHLLQYAYDAFQDVWMFESTATWMEDEVYAEVNDYLRYLPDWANRPGVPLTALDQRKWYGSAVWNAWLDERHGPDVVRDAWARSLSTSPPSFAPGAYGASLAARGAESFSDAFARFSAATAEWRTASTGFSEGPTFPDVARTGALTPDGPAVSGSLDHTAFALFDIPPSAAPALRLKASLPQGTAGALALVGRTPAGGVSTRLAQLPSGGGGTVVLDAPGSFSRITAVLVNADVSHSGFSFERNDWSFTKDAQPVTARASTDFAPPDLTASSPAPGAGSVPLSTNVSASFSEPVTGVASGAFELVGPDAGPVPATLSYDPAARTAVLDPAGELRETTAYTARLRGIADESDNAMPETAWTFTTVRRPPLFRLAGARRQRASAVRRRGLSLALPSSDPDALTYSVAVSARGRRVGAVRGSVAPGGTARRRVRLSAAARRALGAGRPMRLSATATVRDPQGSVSRKRRTYRVRP